ncbi:hypothetical protein GH5_04378 [Leishmania sp. Ghana 2012 LV757]|uniref:hypothetical protein n=1 Tax=Leishmania sp. Ghana 2012 LV757 TaxID=2803181 RepID=UPI001B472CF4|nr:hypothetical protein GH5_04378 [Leishmania sp. Ghana 2012 LV757]
MSLEDWVEQRYAHPVVVVESSAGAEAICARNGMDLIHLLRLHSVYMGGPLYARTGDRSDPVVCNKFGVRLMRTECVRDVAVSQVARHTRRLLRNASAIDLAYGEQLDAALRDVVANNRSRFDGSLPRPVRPTQPSTASSSFAPSRAIGGPETVSTLLERAYPTWHRAFVRDFHSLVRCSSFDTIDYPIGALFAAATTENGGVEGILQVFRAQARRIQELRTSLPGMDTELHQYYLILHDNTSPQSPSLNTARQVLTAVQQLYGTNYCALIKLNSVVDPRTVKNLDPSMWIEASPAVMDVPSADALHKAAAQAAATAASSTVTAPSSPNATNTSPPSGAASPTGSAAAAARTSTLSFRTLHSTCGTWPNSDTAIVTGCYMSPEDVEEVRNVMAYYLSQSLFKFVERRLRMLDMSVQDRRTTTLGKMAAWFKGRDEARPRTAEVVNTPNGFDSSVLPKYVAHSLEMQMRHCGDLSLALHDLKGAISYYRMCIEELLETLALRPYNRPLIAACQEGIGVALLLQGKLAPQSLTPWYTGATSATQRVSSQTNRWEVAWNDYLAAGTQTYAVRLAFLLYESSRVRTPPMLDRCRAILMHLQQSGILHRQNLLNGVVNDMLAGIAAFTNPPFPAGLAVPPSIPRDYPVYMNLRGFARRLQQAGALYSTDNSLEQALRCYLRVLELLRAIDPQETWKTLAEHLYLTAGHLYTQMGQDVRGIALASASVAQGTPLYRNPATAQQAFEGFWAQQKRVLSGMGYALCPHMPMPRILRGSFHVDRNYYSTDTLTDDAARRMSEATAETEWRGMEKHLKKNYTETVLRAHTRYRFPAFQEGGKDNGGGATHGRRGQGDQCGHGGSSSTANNGDGYNAAADARGRASSPPAGVRKDDHMFAAAGATSGSRAQTPRHYTIAKAEPLVISFVMENTIGCPIEATELTLLYLDCASPEQLWKGSAAQTVRLKAGARQRVSLSFDPLSEGEYAIIGLSWCLLDQEGYYYFATRDSRPGCPESLYEYAIENPMPSLDAPENIHVSVTPSKARVTASFLPPLPEHLYDGEYFHTNLIVRNISAQQDAAYVVLQRSPAASHLMYIEEFGRLQNLKREASLLLAEHLKAQETRTFAVTIRAQHRCGDTALQNTPNSFFLLIGYLPGPLPVPEKLPPPLLTNSPELDAAHTPPQTESSPGSATASPTSALHEQFHCATATVAAHKAAGEPAVMVRLHRLLRRCEVQPMVALHSTVLPPANASLRTAVVLTVKNISPAVARTPAAATASTAIAAEVNEPVAGTTAKAADGAQAVPVSSGRNAPASWHAHARGPPYAPVRVARVLAVHSPRWSVECDGTEVLFADRAMHCLLSHGDSLTLPLLIKRRPRAAGEADATVRRVFLSDDDTTTSNGAQCPYTDTTCMALANALPSPARATVVEDRLRTSVSHSERDLFFLQTSCLGPGRVGARPSADEASGGLAFYADKAGQQKEALKTAKQRRCDEVDEERRLCGGPIEHYTPLAIAVAWVREESDVADSREKSNGGDGRLGLREGQMFLFVDPMEHVYQTLTQQQQQQAGQASAATLRPALSTVGAGVSVEQTQQELCEAMLVRYASLKPWQGALVSHVHVPPVVLVAKGEGSDKTVAAPVPVTLRCLSLAPVPLLVTAEALPPCAPHQPFSSPGRVRDGGTRGDPSTSPVASPQMPFPPAAATSGSGVPVLFVGKTVYTFLLMPSEEYEVKFTALALRPGLVDCQRISLSAVSICYLQSSAEKEGDSGADVMRCAEGAQSLPQGGSTPTTVQPLMCTGMTLPSFIRALLNHKTPSAAPRATARVLLSDPQPREREIADDDDAQKHSAEKQCGRQRALQSYLAAAACSSVMTLVESYGTQAAELVRQLAPLGPAGSATVSRVMPPTGPALTRVVMVDDQAATLPTIRDGAVVTMRKAAPAASPVATASAPLTVATASMRPHDAARKFFRQLESFEAELQRARLSNPSDPYAMQYVYRPTVKMAEGSGSRPGYCAANSSFVMPKSVNSGAGGSRSPAIPRFSSSWSTPKTPAAAPSPATDDILPTGARGVAAPENAGGPSVVNMASTTSHKMESFPRPMDVTALSAQGSSSSVRSLAQRSCSDVTEPSSPLHLPAVAFERRAAEAAFTFDISEAGTPSQGSHVHPRPLSGSDRVRSNECMAEPAAHENSSQLLVSATETQINPASMLRRLQPNDVNFAGAAEVKGGTEVLKSEAGVMDPVTEASPVAIRAPATPRHRQGEEQSAVTASICNPLSPCSAAGTAAASPPGFTSGAATGIPPPSPSSLSASSSEIDAVAAPTPPT